jgi:transposase
MSAPIPLRRDFDASQLRGFARKTKDGPQARRLLALAAIYDGGKRTEAAKIGGVGLQIIRDWCYASTHEGLMVSWTASRRGSHPSSTTATAEHLPAWSKVVRSRRSTAWCAGG